ncbi:MAG: inorganic phosphate transporter, partial [Halobacteriales archaeon]|nr:inorganic phosphate transporter [Halobacteriales archaeon]
MLDWSLVTPFVLFVALVALVFDFYNGLHDAANSIATVVATKALPVWAALLLASLFNFLGAFAGTAVAAAIGKGIIDPAIVTTDVVLAALLGAIFWSVLTIVLGIPISSSQSLVGGLIGAALAAAGLHAVQWPTGPELRALGLVLAGGGLAGAAVGMALALLFRSRVVATAIVGFAAGSALWLVVRLAGDITLSGHLVAGAALGALGGLMVARWRKYPAGSTILMGLLAGLFLLGVLDAVGAGLPDPAILGWHPLGGIPLAHVAPLKLGKLTATLLFIAYSPFIGFLLAFVFTLVISWAFRHASPGRVKHLFRYLQIGSSSFYSHGHGRNDAQKTMGVITALLVANGVLTTFEVPTEVILASGLAIALGTLIGGHKVVRT